MLSSTQVLDLGMYIPAFVNDIHIHSVDWFINNTKILTSCGGRDVMIEQLGSLTYMYYAFLDMAPEVYNLFVAIKRT